MERFPTPKKCMGTSFQHVPILLHPGHVTSSLQYAEAVGWV